MTGQQAPLSWSSLHSNMEALHRVAQVPLEYCKVYLGGHLACANAGTQLIIEAFSHSLPEDHCSGALSTRQSCAPTVDVGKFESETLEVKHTPLVCFMNTPGAFRLVAAWQQLHR